MSKNQKDQLKDDHQGVFYIPDRLIREEIKKPVKKGERPLLNIYSKMVYITLCCHIDKDKRCFPGITRIAREVGCSRRQVMRAIEDLVRIPLVIKKVRTAGKNKSYNFYTVLDVPINWGTSDSQSLVTPSHKRLPVTWGSDSQSPGVVTPSHSKVFPLKEYPMKDTSNLPVASGQLPKNVNEQSLHVRIRLAFEELHGGQFANYGKEGPSIKHLIENAKRMHPGEDPEITIVYMAKCLKWLKENRRENYWRDVVVSPSMLLSRWEQVFESAYTKYKDAEAWKTIQGVLK